MNTIQYINEYCSGCGLCKSVYNIEFHTNDRGFPNAHVKTEAEAEKLKPVCPVFCYEKDTAMNVWGTYTDTYIGWSSDPKIRFMCSSGGALTAISIFLLEKGFVDGIVHSTYNPNNPTETITVISKTNEEILQRSGSRYCISVPLEKIKELIDVDRKYAFIGKPCDVMALRNYININVEYRKCFPFLLSFFCAGEPSPYAQQRLLLRLNTELKDCKTITYRGNGWPGLTTVVSKNGETKQIEYKEAWGKYLGRDLRTLCHFCLDGTGDSADIVCADFWYLNDQEEPDFSEHEGRNIIISRTEIGNKVIKQACNDGYIIIDEYFTDKMETEFKKYQPNQFARKANMKTMIDALHLFGRETPAYNSKLLKRYSKNITTYKKARFFLGTIKRIKKGRL